MRKKKRIFATNCLICCAVIIIVINSWSQIPLHSPDKNQLLLNESVDISSDFRNFSNTYYVADELADFDPATGQGKVKYQRHEYVTRQAFNNMLAVLSPVEQNEFPAPEYADAPEYPFSVEFVSSRTIRIRMSSRYEVNPEKESLMLVNGKAPVDKSAWKYEKIEGGHCYKSPYGSIEIYQSPWKIVFKDASGKLLTRSMTMADDGGTFTPLMPFSFVRRSSDYSTSMAPVFALSPDEKIFGCGESFTSFDKRGQKVVLYTDDANGTQNESFYKPIPFFMSSRGYGVFMHTSTPITCDFGKYFRECNMLMMGDDVADLFVFFGDPREVLDEYTDLTGKTAMPPLWSFGFWMSRITYFSESEGREIAKQLRHHRIPSDVIHFDTGWFETDWQCDYQFAESRFDNPKKMISDLKDMGFQTCLWQLPYFVPKNRLFPEIVEKGLYVKDGKGNIPYEDAVLDFSNPETIKWYQGKIAGLLKQGVGVIKVDFGEAAPLNGYYASGRTGFYEHNLYPLRYNKTVADITKKITGENIIWARSTWAGSQRYPLHWGGDAANTNTAMASSLRAGLSMGICGFSFWAHDIGGFVLKAPEDVYLRWTPFGMLSSHTRSHGAPPTEPWEYSDEFLNKFRLAGEMRYKLMPYIYAQAKDCTERGIPMMRALFIDYPEDPGSWLIDNQYLFGSDMLVAPLFENVEERDVYLPPGQWIDYQTGKSYNSGWYKIKSGELPVIVLIKEGKIIPHIKLAQSTSKMDWSILDLVAYTINSKNSEGLICLPSDKKLNKISIDNKLTLIEDPYKGKIDFAIKKYNK